MTEDEKKKKQKEAEYSVPVYTEGESVGAAHEQLSGLKAPEGYSSEWQAAMDETLERIMKRGDFSYNINTDALYGQYRDQYRKLGRAAMDDTVTRASAATGGYANSYAVTAGNAAYNDYLAKLDDVIPELYGLALERYRAEGDALAERYGLLADREIADYKRYRDSVGDYLSERDYLRGVYENERERDYSRYSADRDFGYGVHRDRLADERYADETAYERERDAVSDARYRDETAYERERDALADERYASETAYERARDAVSDARYRDETAYGRSVEAAYAKAEYGDFSGLAALYGIDEASAKAAYERAAAESVSPVESESSADQTAAVDPYGDYSTKDFNNMMKSAAANLEFDEEAAVREGLSLVRQAGSTEDAKLMFRDYFGEELYEKHFGTSAGGTEALPEAAEGEWSDSQKRFLATAHVISKTMPSGIFNSYLYDMAAIWVEQGKITLDEADRIIEYLEN